MILVEIAARFYKIGSEEWRRELAAALQSSSLSQSELYEWVDLYSRKDEHHGKKAE